MTIAIQLHPHGATIAVRAQPGAKKTAVVCEWNGMLKIAVIAPPEEGRANGDIADVLKELLDVRRLDVELLSGKANRNKVLDSRSDGRNHHITLDRWLTPKFRSSDTANSTQSPTALQRRAYPSSVSKSVQCATVQIFRGRR